MEQIARDLIHYSSQYRKFSCRATVTSEQRRTRHLCKPLTTTLSMKKKTSRETQSLRNATASTPSKLCTPNGSRRPCISFRCIFQPAETRTRKKNGIRLHRNSTSTPKRTTTTYTLGSLDAHTIEKELARWSKIDKAARGKSGVVEYETMADGYLADICRVREDAKKKETYATGVRLDGYRAQQRAIHRLNLNPRSYLTSFLCGFYICQLSNMLTAAWGSRRRCLVPPPASEEYGEKEKKRHRKVSISSSFNKP